jgi:hypothetical protein
VARVFARNSPHDYPLTVPAFVNRKVPVADGKFKVAMKDGAHLISHILTTRKFAGFNAFCYPELPEYVCNLLHKKLLEEPFRAKLCFAGMPQFPKLSPFFVSIQYHFSREYAVP